MVTFYPVIVWIKVSIRTFSHHANFSTLPVTYRTFRRISSQHREQCVSHRDVPLMNIISLGRRICKILFWLHFTCATYRAKISCSYSPIANKSQNTKNPPLGGSFRNPWKFPTMTRKHTWTTSSMLFTHFSTMPFELFCSNQVRLGLPNCGYAPQSVHRNIVPQGFYHLPPCVITASSQHTQSAQILWFFLPKKSFKKSLT